MNSNKFPFSVWIMAGFGVTELQFSARDKAEAYVAANAHKVFSVNF